MNTEAIRTLFHEHAIRPTSQRLDIAQVLLPEPQHLCADEVLARVNAESQLVSKATVYNTLNLFVEKGLIREVIIDSGRVFYDSNTSPHHHLYNEDTGQLEDIEACQVEIDKLPTLPPETVGVGIDVIIRIKNRS